MNILSLDLENVLICDAEIFVNPMYTIKQGNHLYTYPRKHVGYFLEEMKRNFDIICLNTSVYEELASQVMQKLDFSYYNYFKGNNLVSKINGLESLAKENHIVHIEDGLIEGDKHLIQSLQIDYIEVKEYTTYSGNDNELLRVCEEVKSCLAKNPN